MNLLSSMRLATRAVAMALAGLSMMTIAAQAQTYYNTGGVAVKGYDVVSYFTEKKAMKGDPQFTHDHGGVKWQFTSAQHRDLFKGDPAKYAPQYAGFCAYGVAAASQLFETEPDNAWTVVDGKLYLNKNASVRQTWAKDIPGYVSKADAAWPSIKK